MTIDEAILLERETVRRNKMMLELDKLMQESHAVCFDKLKREKCIRIHEQLAEWLEELKALKNGLDIKCDNLNEALEKGKKVGYNKAIDDFSERLIEELSHTTLLKDGYYLANIIKPLAEQLKEGVNNES